MRTNHAKGRGECQGRQMEFRKPLSRIRALASYRCSTTASGGAFSSRQGGPYGSRGPFRDAHLLARTSHPCQLGRARGGYGAVRGTVLYYDANWNPVGYWYKPCNGSATRWGVVGVNKVIDDFYSCDCGCTPGGCHPVILSDSPIDSLPSPSLGLVCG